MFDGGGEHAKDLFLQGERGSDTRGLSPWVVTSRIFSAASPVNTFSQPATGSACCWASGYWSRVVDRVRTTLRGGQGVLSLWSPGDERVLLIVGRYGDRSAVLPVLGVDQYAPWL